MIELCASLLAANHAYIARDMLLAERCGITTFHFDVCDGHFAKYLLFGSQVVSDVRLLTQAYFDVHLAVYHMESILETFLPTGADCINLQYESAGEALPLMIDSIHNAGCDVCITFVPDTPYEVVEPFIEQVEAVNILAVNPGIGGQKFNDKILHKVEQCASYMYTHKRSIRLSVDGGVNQETLSSVQSAGATMAIIGSAIFCGSIEDNIDQLRAIIA
jgi:ribulose-phosphate 3-epimerase